MKSRKHRYYIDVTFNVKQAPRQGAKALRLALDQVSRTERIYANDAPDNPMIDKLDIIEIRG